MLRSDRVRWGAFLVAGALLASCGGGGGGGSDLTLSSGSVAFRALSGDPVAEDRPIQISWSGGSVASVLVGVPPGQALPGWLDVALAGSASPLTLTVRRVGGFLSVGHFDATLRVVTLDSNGALLDLVDLPVTFDSIAMPTVSPGSLSLAWTESGQPEPAQLTLVRDARVSLDGAAASVAWLSVSTAGDVLTVHGTGSAAGLAPGTHAASLAVTVSVDGRARTLAVPVNATVSPALTGPAALSFEVNASTTDGALSGLHGTVTAQTPSSPVLDAQADVPWMVPGLTGSGPDSDLSITFPKAEVALLSNGVHLGTVTVSAPGLQALQIPVTLTVRLPEVHFVAPVAFEDTSATDYVVVRGEGLDDPAAELRIAGVAKAGATVVSETELRIVPGAHVAGDYDVEATNLLGIPRGSATLRVVAAPAYVGTGLDTTVGAPEGLLPSPVNGAVFVSYCGGPSCSGTPATVQRFAYSTETGAWTRTQHSFPQLYDIALSPDERWLVVLTSTSLLLVDPLTMATNATIPLPGTPGGTYRQLAVMNDGLVIIPGLARGYSLHDGTFVSLPGTDLGSGMVASRDGSRGFFGRAVNDGSTAYRYFDASTRQIVLSSVFEHYAWGRLSRHAERAMANTFLLDSSLAKIATSPTGSWSSDLSPDGQRIYGLSTTANELRRVDASNPSALVELAAIPIPAGARGRVATDPHGDYVYALGSSRFEVVDVRLP